MKRLMVLTFLVGCTDNANIGSDPVKCQPTAAAAVHGTVSNHYTNKSYSFGTASAYTVNGPNTGGTMIVNLSDSDLNLGLTFSCNSYAVGTYAPLDSTMCPFGISGTVSGRLQEVYGIARSGDVIVDQDTQCLAGRFDLHFDDPQTADVSTVGELSGWFSVPLQ